MILKKEGRKNSSMVQDDENEDEQADGESEEEGDHEIRESKAETFVKMNRL
eukprot:CAMPEP_0116893130 /NCGR_PEP_ID=MMETSP0467-20121206/3190_1 /TAXON_ID=283647 /ORGANISM="Mesodinium pulex, Strain SPMC105" /LENGTH=50 /DNA_ID=CAMNT_0004562625 /DNA_START=1354 /DNA_END=1502 /DNA_ORIENTATION=-